MHGRRRFGRGPFVLLALITLIAAAHLARALALLPTTDHLPGLWVLDTQGVAKLAAGDGARVLALPDSADAEAMTVDDHSGGVWIYGRGQLRGYSAGGVPTVNAAVAVTSSDQPHAVLAVDPERGETWLGHQKNLFRFGPDGTTLFSTSLDEILEGIAVDTAHGRAWALTGKKLFVYDNTGTRFAEVSLGQGDKGFALAHDRFLQEMWVATKNAITRFDSSARITFQKSLSGITLLAPDGRGGLWLAAGHELLHLDNSGEAGTPVRPFGAQGGQIAALAADRSDGTIWAADAKRLNHLAVDGTVLRAIDGGPGAIRGLAHYADTTAPRIVIAAPVAGSVLATRAVMVSLTYGDDGIGVDPSTLELRVQDQPVTASCTFEETSADCQLSSPLPEGSVRLDAALSDFAGNRTQAKPVSFTVDITPPTITLDSPTDGLRVTDPELVVVGHVSEPADVTINGTSVALDAQGFRHTLVVPEGTSSVVVAATDRAGHRAVVSRTVHLIVGPTLPPDPATVAPPIDPTVTTTLFAATQFLYTGSDPIQTGVAQGTIEPRRAAVIRGRVITREGQALPGARIAVKDHPEFGTTLSRADGAFDLAVNGGGILFLDYQKSGYLPAQRPVSTPWQNYAHVDDVVLIELDAVATPVEFAGSTDYQIARGSPVQDADGSRQATILFPPAVTAEIILPNGSRQTLAGGTVRATEYTVGVNGPQAMPGELPPTSGYTYAVELSLDEAIAAGAKEVRFSEPVYLYVDNFLNFPVGGIVPAGWYDRERAAWIPSKNGRIVKILTVENGMAVLDLNGSGAAANAAALAALNITDEERVRLAQLFTPGSSFWRTPITHFTPWDCNWPLGPPEDAEAPAEPEPEPDNDLEEPDCENGSVIECQNQVLGESIPIVGTVLRLNYRSDRVPGRKAAISAGISLSGTSIPNSAIGIDLELEIAGRTQTLSFAPAPGQRSTFTWDGKDDFGREIAGAQLLRYRVGYRYPATYYEPAAFEQAFAIPGVSRYESNRARKEITLWTEPVERWMRPGTQTKSAALGGWTLDPHHTFDSNEGRSYPGDGGRQGVDRIKTFKLLSSGTVGDGGDGGPVAAAKFGYMEGLAAGPDGSIYVADNGRIRKISPSGTVSTVAGGGSGGDGGAATSARLYTPVDVAVGPDGAIYIVENGARRIRRVGSNGIITTVAGGGTGPVGSGGDGVKATLVSLSSPSGIAVGADGTLFIAESGMARIRRVGTDGIITTVAGTGTSGFGGDGGPATQAKLGYPYRLNVRPDGALYIADVGDHRIRRVGPDGIISTVAGIETGGNGGFSGDGGPAAQAKLDAPTSLAFGPDGALYFSDTWNNRIRRIAPDGTISTIAGSTRGNIGNNGPASLAKMNNPLGIAITPDGNLYVADSYNGGIVRIQQLRPLATANGSGAAIVTPSADGARQHAFDAAGRHLLSRDALTGGIRSRFSYTPEGYLSAIADGDGNTLTIERGAPGGPVELIAPNGQRTKLTFDPNGWLATVESPGSETWRLTHDSEGLLRSFENPRRKAVTFSYDELGRFASESNAAGGGWQVTRTPQGERTVDVTVASGEGRRSLKRIERTPTGDTVLTNTSPSGSVGSKRIGAGAARTTTAADGTKTTRQNGPDPRTGMLAPVPQQVTLQTPGGRTLSRSVQRSATLSSPTDPSSVTELTDRITSNGLTSIRRYSAADRSITLTTPTGRTRTMALDGLGRVTARTIPGIEPISYSRDGQGRLTDLVQGQGATSREMQLTYHASGHQAGRLASITDPLKRSVLFEYDAAGRVTQQTLPGNRKVSYSYDANGNLTGLIPPGRDAHLFDYTAVDQTENYDPPRLAGVVTATRYTYNRDKQLTRILRPDNAEVGLTYDGAGRLEKVTFPEGHIGYGYHPTTGKLASLETADGQRLDYTWDGFLLLSEKSTGTVSGTVARTYNNDFRVTTLSVNGSAANYGYDNDGLLTAAGSLSLTRDPVNGLLTGTTLGGIKTGRSHNGFGELTGETATFNGQVLFGTTYQRDAVGRITEKWEVQDGVTTVTAYGYDSAGRLEEVKENGVTVATYRYDDNGNRTHVNGAEVATYDAQDRLLTYQGASYTYTANGELKTKTDASGTTEYHYDHFGNLRQVKLPDGAVIDYLIDGRNRRVGKKVNGVLVQGFVYSGQLRPAAELDGDGNVVARFIYGDKRNIPSYIVKAGKTYRIVSDHLGSPRLVVDTASGAVAQSMEFDAWGNVTADTNPGFQPFGFAGGTFDRMTGFTRFGARDYNATISRWISKDALVNWNILEYCYNDPVNYVDTTGYAPESTRYSSPHAAARDAIGDIRGPTMRDSAEWGGYIYQNPDGTYSYTDPKTDGLPDVVYLDPKMCPKGTTPYASYHTHLPDAQPGPGQHGAENFSGSDIAADNLDRVGGYLGTPTQILFHPKGSPLPIGIP